MLAAHYAVSPETIRRAMFMLGCGIVAIESDGSGAVLSAERASQLVSRFRNISTITELKKISKPYRNNRKNNRTIF
ncbi:MAG: hypothetical protein ACLRXQ_01990 [Phascolarctobacterium faecium]